MAENLEGAKALEFTNTNSFVVAKLDKLWVFDSLTFEKIEEIPITLMESVEREPNEILAIQKCSKQEHLAVITGKNLIMAQQKFNQLYLFKKEEGQTKF